MHKLTQIVGAISIVAEDVVQNTIQIWNSDKYDAVHSDDLLVKVLKWKNILSIGYILVDLVWFLYNVGQSQIDQLKTKAINEHFIHLKNVDIMPKINELTGNHAYHSAVIL